MAKRRPKQPAPPPPEPPAHVLDAINEMRHSLPARLEEIRAGRTQRQFARDLGSSQQNVNRYENGMMPKAEFLTWLLAAEDVNLNWLLGGRGPVRLEGPAEPLASREASREAPGPTDRAPGARRGAPARS